MGAVRAVYARQRPGPPLAYPTRAASLTRMVAVRWSARRPGKERADWETGAAF